MMLSAFAATLIAALILGRRRWTVPVVVAFLIVATTGGTLLVIGTPPEEHFGIAPGAVTLSTESVLALALVIIAAITDRRTRWPLFAVLTCVAALSIMAATVWGGHPEVWSGVLHYTTAFLCLVGGIFVGRRLQDDHRLAWLVLAALGLMILAHLVLAVAQFVGIPVGRTVDDVLFWMQENRAIGLFNHPSTPGKVVLLSLPILLPLTRSASRFIGWGAWVVIGAGIVLTALTLARANLAAVVGGVALWILLMPGMRWKVRGALMGAAAIITVPFAPFLLDRLLSDPEGGYRAELLAIGLAELPEHWLTGLGVNYYSDHVGTYEEMAARGFPVHNTFLLVLIEAGLPLTVVIFAPLIAALILSIRAVVTRTGARFAGLAFLVTIPGLLVVSLTGWGMLSDVLPFWFLQIGVTLGMVTRTDKRWTRRDRGADTSRVLMVTPYSPLATHDHAAADIAAPLARALATNVELHVYAPGQGRGWSGPRVVDGVTYHPSPTSPPFRSSRLALYPRSLRQDWSRADTKRVAELVRELRVDVVHGEYLQPAEALLDLESVPFTVTLHDVVSRGPRPRNGGSAIRRAYGWWQSALTNDVESRLIERAARVVTLSERDRLFIESRGTPSTYARLGVALIDGRVPDPATILFAGALWREENAREAVRLSEKVLPLVRETRPDASLRLVGARPTREVLELASLPGVELVGFVDDYDDEFRRASVVVTPAPEQAGILLKALKACSAGAPTVMNRSAASSLGAIDGVHSLIADGDAETADAIVRLLSDSALATQIGAAAREFVAANWTWEGCAASYVDAWNDVIGPVPEHRSESASSAR